MCEDLNVPSALVPVLDNYAPLGERILAPSCDQVMMCSKAGEATLVCVRASTMANALGHSVRSARLADCRVFFAGARRPASARRGYGPADPDGSVRPSNPVWAWCLTNPGSVLTTGSSRGWYSHSSMRNHEESRRGIPPRSARIQNSAVLIHRVSGQFL